MNRENILDKILSEQLIAIIRLKNKLFVQDVIKNLLEGCVPVIEVTSNTECFSEEIEKARSSYPNATIGAGTIYSRKLAEQAIGSGAQFLVTPNMNPEIISIAHNNNIPVIIGCLTPTEIGAALEHGADIIKLFPAGNFGVDYLRAIRAPFDKAIIFPVGGITLSNIREWLSAGASGFGIGSTLVPVNIESLDDCEKIRNRALKFVECIKDR